MEEMEDEIQAQACKFQRVGNGGKDSNNEEKEVMRRRNVGGGRVSSSDVNNNNTNTNFQSNWQHHSSRIIRVSRTSGGKDRHSKVMTSKGLRDRRVRLSVTTAIQFYDLQDRLGYDQPSKAVEWLIKAASDSISELPSLNNNTPETPKQLPSDHEKTPSHDHHHQQQQQQQLVFDESIGDDETNNHQYHQNQISLSKSACSSNSETSKGSGLSLSRSEIRVKARERARERAAKEKENDSTIAHQQQHHPHNVNNNHQNMSQTASFTELLTRGIGSTRVTVPNTTSQNRNQWSSTVTPMDYFSSSVSALSGENENHSNHELQLLQQQHFPFMHENLMQPQIDHHQQNGSHHNHNDYNLNFTISSGLAGGGGYNRGTLQSNSHPSLNLPHLQRFSTIMDGSSTTTNASNNNNNLPFFIGAANANAAAAPTMENHHHLQ